MTRPADISQDVWEAAQAAIRASQDDGTSGCVRAILAERERCAKVAESYGGRIRLGGINAWHGASTIARAIRAGAA